MMQGDGGIGAGAGLFYGVRTYVQSLQNMIYLNTTETSAQY